jgi:DNA-binding MarR family transcriptional regulator
LELFFATACLFAVTVVASFIYYQRIRRAQEEYEGSKDIIRGITVGFTKQIEKITRSLSNIERDASDARIIASEAMKVSQEASETAKENEEERRRLAEKIGETEKALSDMKEEMQKLSIRPVVVPTQLDVEAPIPLKQDAVLDQLTPTELDVLGLIEEMSEGSVPQIRERIGKTREHTARLLKKLFERGFIDRNTSGMPYRYYIRKEIRELIHQQREKMEISL